MPASGRQKRTKGRVGKHLYVHVYVKGLSLHAAATSIGFHLTFRRVTERACAISGSMSPIPIAHTEQHRCGGRVCVRVYEDASAPRITDPWRSDLARGRTTA